MPVHVRRTLPTLYLRVAHPLARRVDSENPLHPKPGIAGTDDNNPLRNPLDLLPRREPLLFDPSTETGRVGTRDVFPSITPVFTGEVGATVPSGPRISSPKVGHGVRTDPTPRTETRPRDGP